MKWTLAALAAAAIATAVVWALLDEPDDPTPVPPESVASERERAMERALGWLAAHEVSIENPIDAGEQLLMLAEIHAQLAGAPMGEAVRGLLRSDLDRCRPIADLIPLHDVVLYAAERAAGRSGEPRSWAQVFERAERRRFDDPDSLISFLLLWPFFNDEDRARVERICRDGLDTEEWSGQIVTPAPEDTEMWYRLTHIIYAVTAAGKPPPAPLDPSLRDRLIEALRKAIPALQGRDDVDVLAEALVAYRILLGRADETFDEAIRFCLGRQNEDGSFGPSGFFPAETARDYRHPTLVMLWLLAIEADQR